VARLDGRPGLSDAVEELGMMLKAVVEPLFLRTEPDQDTSGPSVPRNPEPVLRLLEATKPP